MKNGDGCSANCQIEINYLRSGGTPYLKDACIKLEGAKPVLKLTQLPTIVELSFTKTIIKSELSKDNLAIVLLDTDLNFYEWSITKMSEDSYVINFKYL